LKIYIYIIVYNPDYPNRFIYLEDLNLFDLSAECPSIPSSRFRRCFAGFAPECCCAHPSRFLGTWAKPSKCGTPNGKRLHNYGKIHHFSWGNSLFKWPCSIAFCKRLPFTPNGVNLHMDGKSDGNLGKSSPKHHLQ